MGREWECSKETVKEWGSNQREEILVINVKGGDRSKKRKREREKKKISLCQMLIGF